MPLLSVYVKLMNLIFIIDDVHISSILEYVVLELDELLRLAHAACLSHPPYLLGISVNDETLRCEVGVQESPEYHYLTVIYCKTAKLRTLSIAAWTRQVYMLQMGSPVEVVRACKIQSLNSTKRTSIVDS